MSNSLTKSNLPNVTNEHQVVKEKLQKENINENNRASSNDQIIKKREELKSIRDQLFMIQKKEDKAIQDYSSLEVTQQHIFNALRESCQKAQIPNLQKNQNFIQITKEIDDIFENMLQQYDENKNLREKIVSNDHHNFIKINEEQNRASDARFKFDIDRLVYEKLQHEHDVLELENQELKELSESIRDEYIGLNSQLKLFEDENARIALNLESQKKKFDSFTEKYIEVKQKNETLNQEREKRELTYKKRIEEATRKRDELQKYIDDVQNQQKQINLKIESNKQIIEDLTFNYDRINSEINKLARISLRRKEQRDQYDLILST